jgi:hypothetical protein
MCFYMVSHVCIIIRKNYSDIIAVENILAFRLCCDLMAWTLGRNM